MLGSVVKDRFYPVTCPCRKHLGAFRIPLARSLNVSTAMRENLGAVLTLRGVTSH